jgi:hypothetical protein
VHPGGIRLILPIEKGGGYALSISAHDRRRVQLTVQGPSSNIEYSTEGRVTNRRIEASFAALGRIDVRLHLVPHPSDPPHEGRCRGRAPLYQEGSYRGTLEFSSQAGVPSVSVKHGHAYLERRFRQVCKRLPRQPSGKSKLGHNVEVGLLAVNGEVEGRTILLHAVDFVSTRHPARSGGNLAVEDSESQEGVRITRRVNISIDHHSFAMSGRGENPEIVEVKLPQPFAGHALYSRSPRSSPSWTGDLSVDLPGEAGVPLTGPGFDAALCRSSSVAKLKRCSAAAAFAANSWR